MTILKKVSLRMMGAMVLATSIASHALTVSKMFGSNMVLQCDRAVPVWGTDSAGRQVTVSFHGQSKQVTTNSSGKWMVTLDAETYGGPYTLTASGSSTVSLTNVLVGEVWIVSGQSNMARMSKQTDCVALARNASLYPDVRFMTLSTDTNSVLQKDVKPSASWSGGDSAAAMNFSAVGYSFGVKLQSVLQKPVGLICMARGGTMIEEFLSPELIASDSLFQAYATYYDTHNRIYNTQIAPGAPFAVQGFIWYQGEQNGVNSHVYRKELAAYIAMLRTMYQNPNAYFGIVQVASSTGQNMFPYLRESQQIIASCVLNTGTVVSMDNTTDDIHPTEKRATGERVADLILCDVYNNKQRASKKISVVSAIAINGNKVRISFANVGGGLKTTDGTAPKCFAVNSGTDTVFHDATATIIDSATIEVSSPSVAAPVALRYAWKAFVSPNLVNGGDHPVGTFRSDEGYLWQKLGRSPDMTAPTAPKNFTVRNDVDGYSLSWEGVTGVEQYCIYAGGFLVAVTKDTSMRTSAISANQMVWVKARDKSYNLSVPSVVRIAPNVATSVRLLQEQLNANAQARLQTSGFSYGHTLSGRRLTKYSAGVFVGQEGKHFVLDKRQNDFVRKNQKP